MEKKTLHYELKVLLDTYGGLTWLGGLGLDDELSWMQKNSKSHGFHLKSVRRIPKSKGDGLLDRPGKLRKSRSYYYFLVFQ